MRQLLDVDRAFFYGLIALEAQIMTGFG